MIRCCIQSTVKVQTTTTRRRSKIYIYILNKNSLMDAFKAISHICSNSAGHRPRFKQSVRMLLEIVTFPKIERKEEVLMGPYSEGLFGSAFYAYVTYTT